MRRACVALLQGDIFTAMADLSNEALNEAMSLTTGVSSFPTPSSYAIESHEEGDGEHRFRVRFQTNQGEIVAAATWRQIDGAWKITLIRVEAAG